MDEPPSSTEIAMRAVIADDDPVVRMLIASAVQALGMQVEEAGDGAGAVATGEAVDARPRSPGRGDARMNGFQACAAIRSMPQGRDVPILIVTGLDDIAFIQRAFDVGATDFVTKPIQAQLLQQRIQFQMRASRAFRDLRETLGELAASQYRLGKSQDLAHLGDWEWRAESDQLALSPRAIRILGCAASPPRSMQELLTRCVHPDDRSHGREAPGGGLPGAGARASSTTGCPRATESSTTTSKLRTRCRVTSLPVAGTVQDITDRTRAEERIRELAFYDSLTGPAQPQWCSKIASSASWPLPPRTASRRASCSSTWIASSASMTPRATRRAIRFSSRSRSG